MSWIHSKPELYIYYSIFFISFLFNYRPFPKELFVSPIFNPNIIFWGIKLISHWWKLKCCLYISFCCLRNSTGASQNLPDWPGTSFLNEFDLIYVSANYNGSWTRFCFYTFISLGRISISTPPNIDIPFCWWIHLFFVVYKFICLMITSTSETKIY